MGGRRGNREGPGRGPGSRERVVDLPRVKAALDRLGAILEEHPELKERTAAFLAGELPGEPMTEREEPMAQKVVKIPEDLFTRAEALIPRLEGKTLMAAASEVTVAAVIRMALALGLDRLETEFPPEK